MKLLKKCLAILLALCLLVNVGVILCKDKNNAQASNSGPYLDSFLAYYFYNLESNYSKNKAGTCGYVATSMMLSYYDNYLNANIIPNNYEARFEGQFSNNSPNFTIGGYSPGVKWGLDYSGDNQYPGRAVFVEMPYIDINTLDYEEYYKNMLATVNNSIVEDDLLQAQLFKIAQESELFSSLMWGIYNDETGAVIYRQVERLIAHYLQRAGFVKVEETGEDGNETVLGPNEFYLRSFFNPLRGDDIKDFVREQIDRGKPVIVAAHTAANAQGEKSGHMVVAYDYDSEGNIYCHFGWGATEKHITLESEDYIYWDSATVIEENFSHVCDDNYVYNGVGYCYHNEEINTYNHTHYFTNCIDYENVDGVTYHTIQCEDCIETRENQTSHCNTIYEYISQSTHKASCLCGNYVNKPHSLRMSETYTDALGRRVGPCTGCGFTIIVSNAGGGGITEMEPWAIGTIKYSVNGSQMLPNGLVILVDEDVKAYNLGTLQFYNENDLETSVI